MKRFCIIFFLSALVFTACRRTDKSKKSESAVLPYKIEIEKNINNTKSLPLSSIGKRLEYIPLETDPECMIGMIEQVTLTESFIFIRDRSKLLQFDKSGRFVRQIGRQGRGPEEYSDIGDSFISKESIFILTGKSVLEFDFNGKFRHFFQLPYLSLHFIVTNPSNLMFYSANLPVKTKDKIYSWFLTDLDGILTSKFENFHTRVNRAGAIGDSPLYLFNGTAYFKEFGSDTLLYLRSGKPEPYAIFNFGSLKMDHDPLVTKENFREVLDRLSRQFWPRYITEGTKYIYITLCRGLSDNWDYAVFNKKTSELIVLKDYGFLNDIDGGIPFWPEYIYNDTLVDFIYADKLLEHINKKNDSKHSVSTELKALGEQITEISNPILIILE
jgi:hypothetical protein